MTDDRIRTAVKVVDPATDANEAGVNASGNFQVVVNEALPTGANTIGAVNLAQAETDDAAVSVGGTVLMSGLVFDDVTPVVVEEGDAGYQRMSANRNAYATIRDAAGAERGVNVTASNELNVLASAQPGTDIGDVTINGFVAAETDADDDVVASAQTSLRTLNLNYGFDGTNWERLQTDAAGSLDVNVTLALPTGANTIGDIANITTAVTPGTAAGNLGKAEDAAHTTGDTGVAMWGVRNDVPTVFGADLDYTPIATDQHGHLQVDVLTGGGTDTPTGEARAHSNSTDTAAGGTFDVDSADFGAATKKLAGFDAYASVPYKATIMSVSNGTETILNVVGAKAGEAIQWRPTNRDYYEVVFTANAGFDGFRVELTNLDQTAAADLYGTIYSED